MSGQEKGALTDLTSKKKKKLPAEAETAIAWRSFVEFLEDDDVPSSR